METTTNLMKETSAQLSNPYGYIKDGKIYLTAYMNFPDRQIGEVKINEEATIKYFVTRFETAKQKVEELYTLVDEAQNKGSYLMKLVHLREYLTEFDGLGDFPELFKKLDVLEEQLREQVLQNRSRNLDIKRALIEEAAQIAENTDWKVASDLIKEVKMKWIKTGSIEREMEEAIEMEFQSHLNAFFDRRKDFFESKIKAIKDRITLYNTIIIEAHQIKNSENWDETADKFKKLHDKWKNVGKIPHKNAGKLWDRFREASDLFFEKYKKAKGLPNKPVQKRVDPKVVAQEKICEEIEGLLEDTTIETGAERTKELMMKWREVGIHPKNQDRKIMERFRLACDKIFETNYLIRVIKRKHYDYDRKPVVDRLRIKIAVMTDLIRKDKSQLESIEVSGGSGSGYNSTLDKEVQNKLNIQKRKISVKETLLAQYQQELGALKK